jgi:hypothetical protein
MNKLNKVQLAELVKFRDELEELKGALELEVEEYNSTMNSAWAKVEKRIIDLNEKIVEADQWRADLASEMQDFYDEKSEKWQEGERGCAYQEWISEWESDLSEVEMEAPEDVDMPDVDAIDTMNELSEEPSW